MEQAYKRIGQMFKMEHCNEAAYKSWRRKCASEVRKYNTPFFILQVLGDYYM